MSSDKQDRLKSILAEINEIATRCDILTNQIQIKHQLQGAKLMEVQVEAKKENMDPKILDQLRMEFINLGEEMLDMSIEMSVASGKTSRLAMKYMDIEAGK